MGRIVRGIVVAGLIAAAGLFAWLRLTTVSAEDLPPLKDADIVFQDSGSSQGLAIMLASGSVYTHTGLVEMRGGKPYVIEAVGPVRTVPLDRWIASGTGGRITIKRLKGLSAEEAARTLARAHYYDGRPYDIFFLDGRDAIYCSELVHAAFLEGAGITVGKVEKVKELNIDNPASRGLIEARWQQHPLCRSGRAKSFEACFQSILEQDLITPVSLARDARLELVYSNFGPAGD